MSDIGGLNLFSFPGTQPAYQDPQTRTVEVLVDNVSLVMETGPRIFNAGDVVPLTEWEFLQIDPARVGPNNDLRSISWGITTLPDATVATSAELEDIVLPIPLGSSFLARDTAHVWQYLAHPGSAAVNGFVDLGPQVTVVFPLPLYRIAGATAVLPPGETLLGTFASLAALTAAVDNPGQGAKINIAVGSRVRVYQSVWNGTAYEWRPDGQVVSPYTITSDLTSRSFDANGVTLEQLADVVATLIRDLGAA